MKLERYFSVPLFREGLRRLALPAVGLGGVALGVVRGFGVAGGGAFRGGLRGHGRVDRVEDRGHFVGLRLGLAFDARGAMAAAAAAFAAFGVAVG